MTSGGYDDLDRWERISWAWRRYCKEGCAAFDWDNDSRKLMEELTDEQPFQWARKKSTSDPAA